VVDVYAKGARKGGSRLAGASEPLALCVLHLASGKSSQFITQSQPISSFAALRHDYDRLTFALSLCELAAAVLPHGQTAEEEFDFMVRSLRYLEVHEKPLVVYVWAQLQLMSLTGFLPQLEECVISGQPISEARPYLSPHAGGYVSAEAAGRYTDRVQTRAEVIYGLRALAALDEPPPRLKFVEECARALLPFWRQIADRSLPATEACANQF
jgi:DNA repair protein RecO (recombination protein O)